MKRMISALLCLVMLCSAFYGAAYAVELKPHGTLTVQLPVTFRQSEARTILGMINEFRTGSDAWYWNESNTTKVKVSGLQPLQYDYDLEKVAMQRAAEIVMLFSHTRPNQMRCLILSLA